MGAETADVIAIKFQADIQDLRSGMAQASGEVAQQARAMGVGAEEGAGGVTSLVDALKQHRLELRQEMGMSRMLGREMSAFGIDAKGAAGEVVNLLSAFSFGGGIGLALEGLKIGARWISEFGKEEREAAAAAEDFNQKMDEQIAKIQERALIATQKGAGWSDTEIKQYHERTELAEKISQIEDDIASAKAAKGGDVTWQQMAALDKQIKESEQRLDELRAKMKVMVDVQGDEQSAEAKQAAADAADKANKDKERRDKEAAKRAAEEAKRYQQQIEDMRFGEMDRAEAEHNRLTEEAEMASAKEREKIWIEYNRAIAKLRADDLEGRLAAERIAEQKEKELREREAEQEAQEQKRKRAETARVQQQAMEDMRRGLAPLKNAIDQVFTGMLDGTMDLAQAMNGLWKGMVKMAVDALVKIAEEWLINEIVKLTSSKATAESVTAGNIAQAVSGAASAVASIPIVGPALAAAAAAATEATLTGMTSPLLAAERGFDIPAGVNPIVQAHQKEMILPEEHAETIRGLKGKGGGDTYVIQAMDAQSFHGFLRKNRGALSKVQAMNERDGR